MLLWKLLMHLKSREYVQTMDLPLISSIIERVSIGPKLWTFSPIPTNRKTEISHKITHYLQGISITYSTLYDHLASVSSTFPNPPMFDDFRQSNYQNGMVGKVQAPGKSQRESIRVTEESRHSKWMSTESGMVIRNNPIVKSLDIYKWWIVLASCQFDKTVDVIQHDIDLNLSTYFVLLQKQLFKQQFKTETPNNITNKSNDAMLS